MDKPASLTVKDFIIRQLSTRMMLEESIIKRVVDHQMEMALKAMDTEESIEFSGFGKLYFNRKKAYKKMEKLEDEIRLFTEIVNDGDRTDAKKAAAEYKLKNALRVKSKLEIKLNNGKTSSTNMGGVEE